MPDIKSPLRAIVANTFVPEAPIVVEALWWSRLFWTLQFCSFRGSFLRHGGASRLERETKGWGKG